MTETVAIIKGFLGELGYYCRSIDLGRKIKVSARITRRVGEVTSTDNCGPKAWYNVANVEIDGTEITVFHFSNKNWANVKYRTNLYHPNSLTGLAEVMAKIAEETDDLHQKAEWILFT